MPRWLQAAARGVAGGVTATETEMATETEVGLCMLNQVDSYPITYSLSNP
jgi:hypothetical protein